MIHSISFHCNITLIDYCTKSLKCRKHDVMERFVVRQPTSLSYSSSCSYYSSVLYSNKILPLARQWNLFFSIFQLFSTSELVSCENMFGTISKGGQKTWFCIPWWSATDQDKHRNRFDLNSPEYTHYYIPNCLVVRTCAFHPQVPGSIPDRSVANKWDIFMEVKKGMKWDNLG